MNRINIPAIKIRGYLFENNGYLPASQLNELIKEDAALKNARYLAARLLWNTRRKKQAILKYTQQMADAIQRQSEVNQKALIQAAIQDEVSAAIRWMVDEQSAEEEIIRRLQRKMTLWVAETLTAWGGAIDWSPLITARIAELERQHLCSDDMLLFVHPDNVARVMSMLPETCGMSVRIDEKLSLSRGVLKSPLMSVDIDPVRDLKILFDAMNNTVTDKRP